MNESMSTPMIMHGLELRQEGYACPASQTRLPLAGTSQVCQLSPVCLVLGSVAQWGTAACGRCIPIELPVQHACAQCHWHSDGAVNHGHGQALCVKHTSPTIGAPKKGTVQCTTKRWRKLHDEVSGVAHWVLTWMCLCVHVAAQSQVHQCEMTTPKLNVHSAQCNAGYSTA
jgi:hypothetical protein